ncbi:hypothetical protein JTB14_010207 [Gonioctena quinquepunctata]|nr:hypothetical protein JTB14_010207 [Gonioctena quinquepunctata]
MSGSDSSRFETTYSQDERIEHNLRRDREDERETQRRVHEERDELFATVFSERTLPIFALPGLKFSKFASTKVRFSFEPSRIARHVSKKVIFHCSLEYYKEYQRWHIKRDSFPVNYKAKIYQLFFDNNFFIIGDGKLIRVLLVINKILEEWAKLEEDFRLDKFMRYQNGELDDLELDTDDEELFLHEEQKYELYEKRKAILKRMLPPPKRMRKRRRVLEFESEESF